MRIGNWEIVRPLGEGRWSKVALAKPISCQSNNADYVIKYVEQDSEQYEFSKKMLIREFACSKLVSHSSIISYLDGNPLQNVPFLVSARHPGESLQSLSTRPESSIGLRDQLTSFRQVGEAISEFHKQGIRHGDVSPSNILLDAENSRSMLLDLGLSEKVDPFHRGLDCIAGTWGFVAPECIHGTMPVNLSADIYSLGMTMQAFFKGQFGSMSQGSDFLQIRAGLIQLIDCMTSIHPLKRPTIYDVVQRVSLMEIGSLDLGYSAAA